MTTVRLNSQHVSSRDGSPTWGYVIVKQALITPLRCDGVYYAVIKDGETGKTLAEVPIWEAKAGDIADVTMKFVVTFMHPKVLESVE